MAVLATDNFNRANNEDLGASWDVMTGEDHFEVVGNQAVPNFVTADATESNNSVTWPNNHYSQVTIVSSTYAGGANDGVGIGVAVRCSTSARTYYRCVAAGTTANGTEIAKLVAGTYTSLANQAAAWVATDTVYLSAVGSTLQAKRNGTNLFSTTDSSIASGRAGISFSGITTSAVIDDWEGGDLAVVGNKITRSYPRGMQRGFPRRQLLSNI